MRRPDPLAHLSPEARTFLKIRALAWPIRLAALTVVFLLLADFGGLHL